jgi:hypothetical protein
LPTDEREKHNRAIEKAFSQLLSGVVPTRDGDGLVA